MTTYTVITTTTWYTTSGQVGGKFYFGHEFESNTTQEKKGVVCRNEIGTNCWIPAINCREVTVTPPPVEPPVIDLTQFDRIVMKRTGHALPDGSIEYGQWTYTGEKDLDV